MLSWHSWCSGVFFLTGQWSNGVKIMKKNNGLAWVFYKVYESRNSWMTWYIFCADHAQCYMNLNIHIWTYDQWENTKLACHLMMHCVYIKCHKNGLNCFTLQCGHDFVTDRNPCGHMDGLALLRTRSPFDFKDFSRLLRTPNSVYFVHRPE